MVAPFEPGRRRAKRGGVTPFNGNSLLKKAANVPLEVSVGQLTVVITGEETNAGLKHSVFSWSEFLCESSQTDSPVPRIGVCYEVCLAEEDNKPARGSQVSTRTEDHIKKHQPKLRPSAESDTSKHVCGKLLCAGRVLSPSLGEYRTGDATGPLRWSGTHGR